MKAGGASGGGASRYFSAVSTNSASVNCGRMSSWISPDSSSLFTIARKMVNICKIDK